MPKPFAAARTLASKANGIGASTKLAVCQKQQQQPVASLGLEIMCADGRRGGKLKTRKVSLVCHSMLKREKPRFMP